MTIDEFETELDKLIDKYLASNDSEKAKKDLIFVLQCTVNGVESGDYDEV